MLKIKHLLFIVFVALCITGAAQEKEYSYQLGAKGGYGFIIAHNPIMQYFTNQHISKYELFLEKLTFGNKPWQKRFNFPRLGMSFSYFNLNNKQYLGKGAALSPHMNFQVYKAKRARVGIKTALGLGYISKPFNVETNFKNAAIGSHFNVFFSILLETEVSLSKDLNLLLGANFSHFSNTSFKTPNLGINVPTAEFGLAYAFGEEKERVIGVDEPFERAKADWILAGGFGFTEIYPPNEKKYVATSLSIAREKKLNYKHSIGAGADIFYNPSIVDKLAKDSIYIDNGWENTQLGLSIYHVLHFGKLESFVQAGYYMKTNDEEIGNLYQTAGGRIKITDHTRVFVVIKTHYANAEYLLFGMNFKVGGGKNE